MKFRNLDDFVNIMKNMSMNKKIYIWGSSIYGDLTGKLFNKSGISWCGYYDNYNATGEAWLNEKPIYEGKEIDITTTAVYILTMRSFEPVKEQLLSAGICEEQMINFDDIRLLDDIEEYIGGHIVSREQIKFFHNIHCREKCFIIGNGPSLSIEDLDRIHTAEIMVSFASNLIFKCYSGTEWRPDYYFFIDNKGIREAFEDYKTLKYVSQNCKYIFSRSNGEMAKYIYKVPNLILFKSVFSKSEDIYDFSSDCSDRVYIGDTVTYAMLQMAVYMGFKEIFLLGMDHHSSKECRADGSVIENKDVKDHSDILGDYPMWGASNLWKATNAYISAKKYADSHGIKIYNATRGGRLEVFERIDFDGLTGLRKRQ